MTEKAESDLIEQLGKKARAASFVAAGLDTAKKNLLLWEMATLLRERTAEIIAANTGDIEAAEEKSLSPAMIDRLLLTPSRIADMARGLEEVADLPDPVGEVVEAWTRPNGLKVERVRIPLGVIAVIYESRPNVTVDASSLCLKSGNAIILRGGSEAHRSNQILAKIMREILTRHRINPDIIQTVPITDRTAMIRLMQMTAFVDVIIPRGGEGLMRFVSEHARVPVIRHDKGVCHLYVDRDANQKMAIDLILNSKVQRPGVCNALENLCVDEKIAAKFLPEAVKALRQHQVELRGDERARQLVPDLIAAGDKDWETEYLDLILSIKIVDGVQAACDFIRRYGSLHTEAIVTDNPQTADEFVKALNSSCIMVNASTRFNDGGQLGLGAEIGISTTKLHAFGPMGLKELTTQKFVVHGTGQVRL